MHHTSHGMVALNVWSVTVAQSSPHLSSPSLLKNGTSNTEQTALATVKQTGKWNQQWKQQRTLSGKPWILERTLTVQYSTTATHRPKNGVKPGTGLNEQENTNTPSEKKSPSSAQDTTNRPRNERPVKVTSTTVQILQPAHSWLAHPCRRRCRTNETLSTGKQDVEERHSHIIARWESLCSGNARQRNIPKEPLPPKENQRESWRPDITRQFADTLCYTQRTLISVFVFLVSLYSHRTILIKWLFLWLDA